MKLFFKLKKHTIFGKLQRFLKLCGMHSFGRWPAGANHFQTISNTWFLDKCMGWKGICVEPNPHQEVAIFWISKLEGVWELSKDPDKTWITVFEIKH